MMSATVDTASVHFVGSSVAIRMPAPKQTADLIFCLRHFIASPSIIVYGARISVLEFLRGLYYYRNRKGGDIMKTLTIGKNDAGQRLDKFLQKRFPTMPKSMMYMYIRKKCVKRNGRKCDISDKLLEGDVLTFFIKDEFFDAEKEKSYEFMKAPAKLDIIYEDDNILLIDKKPGVIVHQDKSYHFDSLVARVQHYLYEKGEYDPETEKAFSPALVNRIDRNTGGIVIAAKNAESLRILNQKMKDRELEKLYLCLVRGTPKPKEATLSGYAVKNESKNKVTVLGHPEDGAKEIRTRYRVLQSDGKSSLVEVELLTGRTHQIRAHMASIGHPLVGDSKYNSEKAPGDFRYQALYSYKLVFRFTSDAGILDYLNGREFTVDMKNIWFLRQSRMKALS